MKMKTKKTVVKKRKCNPMVGKNVIVRANVAGVHAGTVESISVSGSAVVLVNARRLWRHYTRDQSGSVSDTAVNGLKPGADHRIGATLPSVCIINPSGLELAEMTDLAHRSIMEYAVT